MRLKVLQLDSERGAVLLRTLPCALAAVLLPTIAGAQTVSAVDPAASSDIAAVSMAGSSSSSSMVRATISSDALHLVVGRSLFLNTKARLRRVYVADPAVLNSITLSPNKIIVTAMAPGVSSLILLDEAGQAQSYTVSSDIDVQPIRTAIAAAMPNEALNAVDVVGNGDRVVLSGRVGSDALAATAVKLASLYSKDVANSLTVAPGHPKQVRLKVRILEVDRSKLTQMGINLFNPGGNTSYLASTTTQQFPSTATMSGGGTGNTAFGTLTTSNPLNFMLYSSKLNLGATVQDLESKNVLQILAEPTITTISGEKANFLSGGEFPFPVIQPGGGASTTSSVTIQFRPYGVKLEFAPIVNEDGTVRLKVSPEVSALDYTNAVSISGYSIPALSTRKADTEVELRSNQSFAISGLLDQRTTDLLSKTPGAASIPILGALFKSKNITHSTTELVVIVTPTVVDPLLEATDPVQPDIPIAPLNKDNFDKSLGKRHNPNPTVPPMNSSPSPFINQVTPPNAPPAPVVASESDAPQKVVSVPVMSDVASAPSLPATDSIVSVVAPQQGAATPEPAQSALPQKNANTSAAGSQAVTTTASAPTVVQIMTLSHKEDADAMVVALKRHGYDVAVTKDPADSRLHLELGPFKDKTQAEAARQRLLADGYNATIK